MDFEKTLLVAIVTVHTLLVLVRLWLLDFFFVRADVIGQLAEVEFRYELFDQATSSLTCRVS